MSSRRTAILIGAIAIGVVAVLLIVRYVQGKVDDAENAAEKVNVFLAVDQIKRGEDGTKAVQDKKIDQKPLAKEFVPGTAIQSTDAVQRKVALFNIEPGMVIVDGMFVDPQLTQVTFRERLKDKNFVAISILVNPTTGVGGFLVPGDRVNIMILQDNAKIKESLDNPTNGQNNPPWLPHLNINPVPPNEAFVGVGGNQWIIFGKTARYLFQNVSILAVGSNQLLGPGESATTNAAGGAQTAQAPNNTNLITFQVPPQAAQWIATGGATPDGFYLSLVRQDYEPRDNLQALPPVVDRLPGEDPSIITPYKYADKQGNTPDPG